MYYNQEINQYNFLIAKLSHREIRMARNYMKIFNISNKKCKERSVTQKLLHIYVKKVHYDPNLVKIVCAYQNVDCGYL